jgi:hypothetical protein
MKRGCDETPSLRKTISNKIKQNQTKSNPKQNPCYITAKLFLDFSTHVKTF